MVRRRGLELFCASDKMTKRFLSLHMAAKLVKLEQPTWLFSPSVQVFFSSAKNQKLRPDGLSF